MKEDVIDILTSPEGEAWIESNLYADPAKAALKATGSPVARAALAAQLKYLQKARKKLPDWYEARCIVPALAFEQCSGQIAALEKPRHKGKTCLDLTCGLGVDSWAFSKSYEQVVSIEADPLRAKIARHNFAKLGCNNIKVINTTAEDFLEGNLQKFDMAIVDPSRRDGKGRKFLFEDCQPNVLEIQDKILAISTELMIKASPLFDLAEGFRKLKNVFRAEVLSVNGEVKEVLFTLSSQAPQTQFIGSILNKGGKLYNVSQEKGQFHLPTSDLKEAPKYILEPDAAIYKAGLASEVQTQFLSKKSSNLLHNQAYLFSTEAPEHFPGRIFMIREKHSFKPAALKRIFKQKGIKKAWIGKRNFKLPVKEIFKKLNLQEGGKQTLLFTEEMGGEKACYFVERQANLNYS